MKDPCAICGNPDANIFCRSCGKIVCDNCYNNEEGLCISCKRKNMFRFNKRKTNLLILGLILTMTGLMITALAILSDTIGGDKIVIVFPFLIGGADLWSVTLMSVIFFSIFALSTILPYFLSMRRYSIFDYVDNPIYISGDKTSQIAETIEYMITTRIPTSLRRTIYIEEGDEEIHIRSQAERAFDKTYALPEGFEVKGIDYDYEEEYLLLKLKLVRLAEF